MNFLTSWKKQPTATDARSSEKFGAEMGEGWIQGLRSSNKVGTFQYATEIKVLRSGYFQPHNRRILGDFDILMSYNVTVTLQQILPDSGYIIRPQSAWNWLLPGVIAEIKRSCDPIYMQHKISNFVHYYQNALDPKKVGRNVYTPV
jgi:hypothetical protein